MPNSAGSVTRQSLLDRSRTEALVHKWIESEKAGCDLGEAAIKGWVRHHWSGFLRAKWIEHVEGISYWIELEHRDFGLFRTIRHDSAITPEIFELLKRGKENLDIIVWAQNAGHDIEEVLRVLEQFDINRIRLESRLLGR
jgi:hypothetical protein